MIFTGLHPGLLTSTRVTRLTPRIRECARIRTQYARESLKMIKSRIISSNLSATAAPKIDSDNGSHPIHLHVRSELDEFQVDSEALFQIIKDLNLQWNFFAANNRIRQRSGGEKGLEDNHRLGWGNAETHCGVGTNRARLPLGDRVGNLK